MRAGKLNTRVTIQAPGSSKDAAGRPADTWTEVATVWAEVKATTGRERWANEHVAVTAPISVRIRWRDDIDSAMRVQHGSRYYALKGEPIDPDSRRRELILTCEEVKN